MTAPLWMLPWIYDHEDADLGVDLPTDDDPNAAYVGTADEGVDRLIGPGEGARFVITVHAGTVTAVGYG